MQPSELIWVVFGCCPERHHRLTLLIRLVIDLYLDLYFRQDQCQSFIFTALSSCWLATIPLEWYHRKLSTQGKDENPGLSILWFTWTGSTISHGNTQQLSLWNTGCIKKKNHAAEQPLGEAKTCIFIPLVPDLAGSEGLPGPHANSGPPRTSQCHWPARAPFPAAERLTTVPGPAGGAVSQAHVPLLTREMPTFSQSDLARRQEPGSSSTRANGNSASEEADPVGLLLLGLKGSRETSLGDRQTPPHGSGHERSTLGVRQHAVLQLS